MEKKKLLRTKQCLKCPWKKSTNPYNIPDGYSKEKHENLKNTIANPHEIKLSGELRAMACHESDNHNPHHCVGWLYNQINEGNNILLRIQMMHYDNAKDISVFGDQHEKFEDTLPKD